MGKIEVITSVERRRKWSDSDKKTIVEESYQPGINLSHLAKRHKIMTAQIYQWRKQFGLSNSSMQHTKSTERPEPNRPSIPLVPFKTAVGQFDEIRKLKEYIVRLERIIAKRVIDVESDALDVHF